MTPFWVNEKENLIVCPFHGRAVQCNHQIIANNLSHHLPEIPDHDNGTIIRWETAAKVVNLLLFADDGRSLLTAICAVVMMMAEQQQQQPQHRWLWICWEEEEATYKLSPPRDDKYNQRSNLMPQIFLFQTHPSSQLVKHEMLCGCWPRSLLTATNNQHTQG